MKFSARIAAPALVALVSSSCAIPASVKSRAKDPYAEYFKPAVRVYFDTGEDEEDELDIYEDGALSPAVDFLGINFPFLVREGKSSGEVSRAVAKQEAVVRAAEKQRKEKSDAALSATDADTKSRAESSLQLAEWDLAKEEARLEQAQKQADRSDGTRLDGDWVLAPRFAVGMSTPADDSEDGSASASGAPVVYFSASLVADFQKGGTVGEDDGVGVRLEFGYMYGVSSDESFADADDSAVFVGMTVNLD